MIPSLLNSIPAKNFPTSSFESKKILGLLSKLMACCSLIGLLSTSAIASHYEGGQIAYNYLENGRYEILIKSYWHKSEVAFVYPRFRGPFKLYGFPQTVSKTLLADGETIEHVQKQEMSWSTPGIYEIYWKVCCSRSEGSNFNRNDTGINAVVNFDASSPRSSSQFHDPFYLNFKANQPFEYKMNIENPAGNDQVYTLEIPSGLPADAFDELLGAGFELKSDGILSWQNPKTGKWLINIKVWEKVNGKLTGAYSAKEYIMNILPSEGNNQPVFTSIQDHAIQLGQQFSFEVEAYDMEGQFVILNSNGIPFKQGASFVQNTTGSTALGTFNWAPTEVGTYNIQLVASEDSTVYLTNFQDINLVVATCNQYATNYNIIAAPCAGTNNGKISLGSPKGISPFQFSLDSGKTFQNSPDFEGLTGGTYIGRVKDAIGCLSDPSTIYLEEIPLPDVVLDVPSSICKNSEALLLAGGSPAGGIYTGTGVNDGIFSPELVEIGSHTLYYTFTNENGCSNTASASIEVQGAPVADAGSDVLVYTINGTSKGKESCTTLSGSASNGNAPYEFLWSNGETTQNIEACPTATTTYYLTVTDVNGCSHTDGVTVSVEDRGSNGTDRKPEHAGPKDKAGKKSGKGMPAGANARTAENLMSFNSTDASDAFGFTVFPNPITEQSRVQVVLEEEGPITIELLDQTGKLVKEVYRGQASAGQAVSYSLNVPTGKNQLYICRLITSKGIHLLKLMK